MQSKTDSHTSSAARRLERTVAFVAIVAIALIPIAIILSYRSGFETTTTSGVVIGLLAASGLLALKRASLHARVESDADSRAA